MKKLWEKLKIYLRPFFSWKFLVCYLIAWSWHIPIYGGIICGYVFDIPWLYQVGWSIVALMFSPICKEDLFQIPLAIWLNAKLFKNDKDTMDKLNALRKEANEDWERIKSFFRKIFKKKIKSEQKD